MRPFLFCLYLLSIALPIHAQDTLLSGKAILAQINGLWIEEQYLQCVDKHRSVATCAHNVNFEHICIYIPAHGASSDTLRFITSSLHTHDMLEIHDPRTKILSTYFQYSKIPDSIPSGRYPTDPILYFSDSTHTSYLQFVVQGKDILLMLTRDSTDAAWGKGHIVYRRQSQQLDPSLMSNPIHSFLNKTVTGKYWVHNAKGRPLGKWLQLKEDGSLQSDAAWFLHKRYHIGTEFYCYPYPDMDYMILVDLTPSKQYIKETKEYIVVPKTQAYGYTITNEGLYLYEFSLSKRYLFKKRLKYILKAVK